MKRATNSRTASTTAGQSRSCLVGVARGVAGLLVMTKDYSSPCRLIPWFLGCRPLPDGILLALESRLGSANQGGTMPQERNPATAAPEAARAQFSAASFIRGFHGVRYQVADVKRSVASYTQQLGFN